MSLADDSIDKVHCCYIDGENLQVIDVTRPQNYNRPVETDIVYTKYLCKQG